MRKGLKKLKKQYDIYLLQNRWAEILVVFVIIGFSIWAMWAFFRYKTSKEWAFIDSYTGEVTGLSTGARRIPIVYTLVKLDDGTNVVVYIPPEYDIRAGRFVVLDKYVNKKRTTEFKYGFNPEHQ